ncbi:fructose-1,6-bisphosphatase [Marinilactibacillus psychrotolerans]|uniref:Fructose-1,6-bisphosphatase class 3 n=1 Tax=Marinilactibacillus psychrotolerans TaxID=191770 RepID=A0AAV3WRW0_9LACT|nr:fructose-1,6-bisphosphatase [Marinilactibacillus psychrotolerans]GEL65941.1 fructose-1,6-bisphosphatase class 3 [Marinilactibacillus psychrotolerans]GEQ34783.1 fructose-1,6-bisphosphatase [Marinilactibacillus psychrotolerans]SDC11725.1 fructose-1,6-bisphosphatase-3 [Marinilactibacillus psychrotolerans]
MKENKYLELLKEKFETPEAIYTELINLEAIQNLPKGTELYLSDVHGADRAFDHILRTGAGNLREKINNFFGEGWSTEEMDWFNLFISYPREAMEMHDQSQSKDKEWSMQMIRNLIDFMQFCAVKYTRSKLRKALPKEYIYVIEELLYTDLSQNEKDLYYKNILYRLISLGQAEEFMIKLCKVIQRLVIDHLHLVGDIFDRASGEKVVMEKLMAHHSVDIQWGNHDLLWMGAMYGSKANLITMLRIAARYGYLFELEKTYGLNLRPLFLFAEERYGIHPNFEPKVVEPTNTFQEESEELLTKVHQALAVIQFKLEGQIIKRRPEFEMDDRLLLDKINFDDETITIDNKQFQLNGFPVKQFQKDDPYKLCPEEEHIVNTLLESFQQSEKLVRYIDFLLKKGSMYLVYNGQLLYHGCIPLTEQGAFDSFSFEGEQLKGRKMLDKFEEYIRNAASDKHETEDYATDLLWYSWTGKKSPLFGRDRMTTFERYYIEDDEISQENRNPYFKLRDNEEIMLNILKEFNLKSEDAKVINGHTPVKAKKGELPVKANGRLIVIDGGMSAAYQKSTGIAGYSLINNSYGFQIVTHQPFDSIDALFDKQKDETSLKQIIDGKLERKLIKDTTIGDSLQEQINDLQELLYYLKRKK